MKGILYVKLNYNNTIITLTDLNGNTIAWTSSGRSKFKGSKKSTNFASQISTEKIIKIIKKKKIKEIEVITNGPGICRESVLRTLNSNGILIKKIKDTTNVPHNGCRPKKKRRI